jgi:hypothetical protein
MPVSVHLDVNQTIRQYHCHNTESSAMSTLNHYFCHSSSSFNYRGDNLHFRELTYIEYFSLFHLQKYDVNRSLRGNHFVKQLNTYGQPPMHVILQNESRLHLSRLHDVPLSHGEVFYL